MGTNSLPFELQRESTGGRLVLDEENTLGTGGEATVYSLADDRSLAAKGDLKPSRDRARKLVVMAPNPPAGATAGLTFAETVFATRRASREAGRNCGGTFA